jgi:hypothetical protein
MERGCIHIQNGGQMNTLNNENTSKAQLIKSALHMHKSLLKKKQFLTDFKEPVAFLMRRNHNIEFYENASSGYFYFKHTDGDKRNILLTPNRMHSFPYAGRKVRCYILHEDFPLPLPEDPIVSSELITISQQKTMQDFNKYKLKEAQLKQGNIKAWFIGIAVVIGAIALAAVLIPQSFWDNIFHKETVKAAAPMLNMIMFIPKKWLCSRQGEAWLGRARRGTAWLGTARQGKARI